MCLLMCKNGEFPLYPVSRITSGSMVVSVLTFYHVFLVLLSNYMTPWHFLEGNLGIKFQWVDALRAVRCFVFARPFPTWRPSPDPNFGNRCLHLRKKINGALRNLKVVVKLLFGQRFSASKTSKNNPRHSSCNKLKKPSSFIHGYFILKL